MALPSLHGELALATGSAGLPDAHNHVLPRGGSGRNRDRQGAVRVDIRLFTFNAGSRAWMAFVAVFGDLRRAGAKHARDLFISKYDETAMQRSGAIFLLAALTFPVRLPAADWPRFRGPNGAGVAETSALPDNIGPHRHVVWKTALPPGHSAPVIGGDRIFTYGVRR
jgi:hypothetical protein